MGVSDTDVTAIVKSGRTSSGGGIVKGSADFEWVFHIIFTGKIAGICECGRRAMYEICEYTHPYNREP
jgi:hypothetical protein